MVKSAVNYSNVLASSIRQLEEDKHRLAEFYDLIYQSQYELEEKHKNLRSIVENQDKLLQKKC